MTPDQVAGFLHAVGERIRHDSQGARGRLLEATTRLAALADDATPSAADLVEETDLEAAVDRVQSALRANDFRGLRQRDVRLAIRKFTAFTIEEVERVFAAYPRLRASWARRFFADRVDLSRSEEAAWIRLLADSIDDIRLLDGTLDRPALLYPDAPRSAEALAAKVHETVPIALAFQGLTSPGLLDPRWKYTALVLASCVMQRGRSLAITWHALSTEPQLEALLIPERPRAGESWFGRGIERPTVDVSIDAQARMAAAFVRDEARGGDVTKDGRWRAMFFESKGFGDPREFVDARERPTTPGWQGVKALVPNDYSAFIDSLLREDITLFFSSVEIDSARKAFWLRYVKAASSTVFFLSQGTREALKAQFSQADASVRAALNRARKLSRGDTDAFAMRFGRYVMVEFSQHGNAAYLYPSSVFDQFANGSDLSISSLKRKDLGGVAFRHAPEWEYSFMMRLAQAGIYAH